MVWSRCCHLTHGRAYPSYTAYRIMDPLDLILSLSRRCLRKSFPSIPCLFGFSLSYVTSSISLHHCTALPRKAFFYHTDMRYEKQDGGGLLDVLRKIRGGNINSGEASSKAVDCGEEYWKTRWEDTRGRKGAKNGLPIDLGQELNGLRLFLW